ncbi:MAG: 30S ribosomal protein S20, partial [Bacilli bacterium]
AVITTAKKKVENNNYKASMRTAIKNVEKAIASKDKEKASDTLKIAIKAIDKAASAKVVTANYVARNKSRLTVKVNTME